MNMERRQKPRICDPIPVMVHCTGMGKDNYEFDTIAKNISAGGLYAPAPRPINIGTELRFRIRFALAGADPLTAPAASARGKVVRAERDQDGTFCFAASFTRHRVL